MLLRTEILKEGDKEFTLEFYGFLDEIGMEVIVGTRKRLKQTEAPTEPEPQPTQLDRIEAMVDYMTMQR